MKITLDVSQAQYPGTGVGNYTLELVKELIRLDTLHTFTLYAGVLKNRSLLNTLFKNVNARKVFVPLPPKVSDMAFNRLKFPPIDFLVGPHDIFHSSDWTQPKSLSGKMITTIHDVTTLKFPEHQHQIIIDTHKRRLDLVKEYGVHVIADSEATKKDLIDMIGLDASKIDVVYLAASQDFLDFSQLSRQNRTAKVQAVKKKYKLDRKYILSVGTNEPRKNLGRTVESFTRLQEQFPQLDLAIAGKYGWGKSMKQEARNKKQDSVKLLGFVDQDDLPALYTGAEAFVYPSLYEGFGLPVLEAMTVGTPVVTSKRGSLAEVAADAAVVVNPVSVSSISEGLIEVLNDQMSYRKKGMKQADKFSWKKTAEDTLAIYEKLQS